MNATDAAPESTRILLLEDSDADAYVIESVLRSSQIVVERVTSLGAAVVALRSSSFDLILSDLGLPDSTGLGTVESLLDAAGLIPVVVMTGRDEEETALDAVAAGAQDFLVKGSTGATALIRAVRYALQRGKARHEVTREELHSAHGKFRALIEARDVTFVLDAQQRCRYVSPAAGAMLGYQPVELIGRRGDAVIRSTRSGRASPLAGEAVLQRKDGSAITVEYTSTPMFRDDGEADGVVMMFHDKTRQVQLEQQVEQTLRLAALGRASASVVHELNNVLMGLGPFAEVLHRRSAQDASLEMPSRCILNTVRRGRRLSEEILRFTRPPEPQFETIQLRTWLAETAEAARGIAEQRRFVVDPPDALTVCADADQLTQIAFNLIANARDATPPGGTVTLGAAAAESVPFVRSRLANPARFAVVFVRDDGSGITEDVRERLFEPLFTTRRGGTGLGLPTVQRIAVRHGGDVLVDSSPGVETTFFITLPRVC